MERLTTIHDALLQAVASEHERFGTEEIRIRSCDLLANRLNTRRSVREIVLPRLEGIEATLAAAPKEQLDRIEKTIESLSGGPR